MSENPAPASSHPDDRSAAFVESVVRYDEGLRAGNGNSTHSNAVAGETPDHQRSLFQCLDLLERAWPRCPDTAPLALPQRIGKFAIQGVLGHGGFGIVYLARDTVLGRAVALKVPRLHALTTPTLLERFEREARAAGHLDHPNIVPVYEAGSEHGVCYIASAYCDGPNLAKWLREQGAPVSPRTAARVLVALADAVSYSHGRGVLHRDIKPSNVVLAPAPVPAAVGKAADELPFTPRLTDFGLAKIRQEAAGGELADDSAGTTLLGTPAYMAPEQLESGPEAVGPAADVYALGVVLYELLAGRPPHQGASVVAVLDQVRAGDPTTLRRVRPDIPPALENICHQCLARSPAHRYRTAADLRDDLQRFLGGLPVTARGLRWGPPVRRLISRQWATATVLGIVLTAVIVGAIVALSVPGIREQPISTAESAVPASTATPPAEPPGVRDWRVVTRDHGLQFITTGH